MSVCCIIFGYPNNFSIQIPPIPALFVNLRRCRSYFGQFMLDGCITIPINTRSCVYSGPCPLQYQESSLRQTTISLNSLRTVSIPQHTGGFSQAKLKYDMHMHYHMPRLGGMNSIRIPNPVTRSNFSIRWETTISHCHRRSPVRQHVPLNGCVPHSLKSRTKIFDTLTCVTWWQPGFEWE